LLDAKSCQSVKSADLTAAVRKVIVVQLAATGTAAAVADDPVTGGIAGENVDGTSAGVEAAPPGARGAGLALLGNGLLGEAGKKGDSKGSDGETHVGGCEICLFV